MNNVSQLFIIVDDKSKWKPYYPTDQVISAEEYLFDKKYQVQNRINIINLCLNSRYLSLGHYCSMIAEARGHRALPTVKTMGDLQAKSLYFNDLDFVQSKVEKAILAQKILSHDSFKILSIFGKCTNKYFQGIAQSVFDVFPAPILSIKFEFKNRWRIHSIKLEPIDVLKGEEEDFFANTLNIYSNKVWRSPKYRKKYNYDLAILVDPTEKMAPSDYRALKKFEKACHKLNVFCEFIGEKDYPRINEFDALFVRTTTAINNFTYKFVKAAEMEGLVVIDDSDSMIRCTNKVFVSNLLTKNNVPIIPGRYVSNLHPEMYRDLIEEFELPLICKIPDGSFSTGVKKADTYEELTLILEEMYQHSSLILVQKFMRTDFDWRIGILDGEVLFACQYYMSRGHWQIYNHQKNHNHRSFSGAYKTFHLTDVPPKVIKYAKKAAGLMGDGLYGVDLKEDDKGNVFVVEINDNPNIDAGVEDKILGEELYLKIIKYFIRKLDSN
jgi:glutathione synthase/RimK-type ligase-like ATP-grasp enzyme